MSIKIEEKSVPAMRVVTHMSRVNIATFQDHIKKTLYMLATHIQEHGTIAGDPMCFYHGPVNEEADGPVEIVWPYAGDVPIADNIGARIVPAHKIAYHKADMEHSRFPKVLQVWDAVVDHARENGLEKKVPEGMNCYEIWPEDLTTTVAWPYQD